MPPKPRSKRATVMQKRGRRDDSEPEGDGYDTSAADDDIQALDSDYLDGDEGAGTAKRGEKADTKRKKRASASKPKKRRKKAKSDEDESDQELKQGQEVVGKIVRAPNTGQGGVPDVPREIKAEHSSQSRLDRYLGTHSTF